MHKLANYFTIGLVYLFSLVCFVRSWQKSDDPLDDVPSFVLFLFIGLLGVMVANALLGHEKRLSSLEKRRSVGDDNAPQ